MPDTHVQFIGSIPEKYDEHLGPLFFHFYAEDLAKRIDIREGRRVLELACGTGIYTEVLRRVLPDAIEIVATDFNEPMLDYARERRGGLDNVLFEQADALSLPYDDGTFDGVVCQFGIMFFPDKFTGMQEARRVLRPGGQFLFNVWDSFDFNPIARIAFETIGRFFADDPPTFLQMPFGYYDIDPIKALLDAAGFSDLQVNIVSTVSELPSASSAAEGLVTGNPNILEIQERGSALPERVIAALEEAIIDEFGDSPMRTPLQAITFSSLR